MTRGRLWISKELTSYLSSSNTHYTRPTSYPKDPGEVIADLPMPVLVPTRLSAVSSSALAGHFEPMDGPGSLSRYSYTEIPVEFTYVNQKKMIQNMEIICSVFASVSRLLESLQQYLQVLPPAHNTLALF